MICETETLVTKKAGRRKEVVKKKERPIVFVVPKSIEDERWMVFVFNRGQFTECHYLVVSIFTPQLLLRSERSDVMPQNSDC